MHAEFSYLAALLVGLFGGVHCVGMCGGIVGALSFGLPEAVRGRPLRFLPYLLGYNGGRLASYAFAGALMGGLGMAASAMGTLHEIRILMMALAGLFLVGMGLYLGGWWFGLARVERLGQALWRFLEPIGRRFIPVRSPANALALGLVWGWLPCGLVYTALAYAAASAQVVDGALLMIAFGVGTAPAMVMGGLFAARARAFLQSKAVRTVAALAMVVFGIWTLAGVAAHWQHSAVHTQSGAHHHH